MPRALSSDIVILVLIEETLELEPGSETRDVPMSFRRRVRAEVEAIKKTGGVVDIPFEMPDPRDKR